MQAWSPASNPTPIVNTCRAFTRDVWHTADITFIDTLNAHSNGQITVLIDGTTLVDYHGHTGTAGHNFDFATIGTYASYPSDPTAHVLAVHVKDMHSEGPAPTAFYVATNGNDGNPGTLASPFATLARAQTAMRNSSTVKTTYVRGGTYNFTTMLTLTQADNGETWSYYPLDGYNSAILDATNMAFSYCAQSGNNAMILVEGANITINGLKLQNFSSTGIQIVGDDHAPNGTNIFNIQVGDAMHIRYYPLDSQHPGIL